MQCSCVISQDAVAYTWAAHGYTTLWHYMCVMLGVMAGRLHYKDALCAGQYVSKAQRVHNMEFYYQPPPRNIVPHAAALKGHQPR